jgi:hypothetical protein
MIGRTNTGGSGGGGGYNFTIVGGTTRPANSTQNMVWVNTSHEITSYVLSATEPETPTSGMLWVKIDNTSPIKVCAPIGNDLIVLYLRSAVQYINGAWESVPAQCYQDGEWNAFVVSIELIKGGQTEYTLKAIGKGATSIYTAAMNGQTITKNADSISITGKGGYGIAYIEEAVDLTPYNTLTIRGKFTKISTDVPCFMLNVWTSIGTYIETNRVARTELNADGETVLDISKLKGNHIVGIDMASQLTQIIYDIVLT